MGSRFTKAGFMACAPSPSDPPTHPPPSSDFDWLVIVNFYCMICIKLNFSKHAIFKKGILFSVLFLQQKHSECMGIRAILIEKYYRAPSPLPPNMYPDSASDLVALYFKQKVLRTFCLGVSQGVVSRRTITGISTESNIQNVTAFSLNKFSI